MLTTKNTIMSTETKVFPNDTMVVYGSGTSKHMKKNKEYTVHKLHGERLIAEGKATATPAEGGKAKGGK